MPNFAIAHAMKRKMKKMAEGGDAEVKGVHKPAFDTYHKGTSEAGRDIKYGGPYMNAVGKAKHKKVLEEMQSMPKPKLMAEGGEMEDHHALHEHHMKMAMHHKKMADGGMIDEDEGMSGYLPMEDEIGGEEEEHTDPMIKKILMGRMKGYSEGGQIANEDSGESASEPDDMAKWDDNEFDDLALRDKLSSQYTGSDSGDELGDVAEDDERKDMVSRVMKSRSKRDRMAVSGEGSSYGRRK